MRKTRGAVGSSVGTAVDAAGNVAYDPSQNVIALVEANARAAASLREEDVKFNNAAASHIKEIFALQSEHNREARVFDRDQAKAIREVDQTNAQANAAQILQAVNTNASVAQQTALTLAKQVTDTAAAQETRQSARDADTAKRLSAVELSMSKGEGKQQVADPAMTATLSAITTTLANLTASQERRGGKSEGMDATWKMIIAAVGLLTALNALGVFNRAASTPAPIYFPAPAGTVLPNAPQGATSR